MGHIRLGQVPKTQKWRDVVSTIAGDEDTASPSVATLHTTDVPLIARRTLEAARNGLDRATNDSGLRYTFYLLTQLVLSARKEDWQAGLKSFGLQLTEDATVFDLTAELQDVIDSHLVAHGTPTDISEIAQQAAGESIFSLAGPRVATLFGSGRTELQAAVRELSTKKGFAELGQHFFGRFMARYLNFYISRITAEQVDGDNIHQLGDITQFNDALQLHCYQSARIVRDFCSEWYSKTEFREGISLENTSGFMAIAIKKLQAELQQQESEQ